MRVDAILARATMLQAGIGLAVRTGYNVRAHAVVAGGIAVRDGLTKESARGDATLRLLLDPFGESRIGLSIGGGLGLLHDGFEHTRPIGLLVLGLEGAPRSRPVWAMELGLGGGARVGLVLRPRLDGAR
ncbi:MAG: hypothetical protein AB1762_00750 [Gemmatimonadota bacterium]